MRCQSYRPRVLRLEDRVTPATLLWQGDVDNLWSTDENWLNDIGPISGNSDELIFPGNTTSVQDIANLSVARVEFQVGNNLATLQENLTVDSGTLVEIESTGQTLVTSTGGSLILGNATVQVVVNAGSPLTMNVPISGAGGMSYTGAGSLELGGATANTYTGTTIANGLTLSLIKPVNVTAIPGDLIVDGLLAPNSAVQLFNSAQIADTSDVTIRNQGTLRLVGFNDTIQSLTLLEGAVTGVGTITVTDGVTSQAGDTTSTISANLSFANGAASQFISTSNGTAGVDLLISGAISTTGVTDLSIVGMGRTRLTSATGNPGLTAETHVYGQGRLDLGVGAGVAVNGKLNVGPSVVTYLGDNQLLNNTVIITGGGIVDLNDFDDTYTGFQMGSNSGGGRLLTGTGTLTIFANVQVFAAATPSRIQGNIALDPGIHVFVIADQARMIIEAIISGPGLFAKSGLGTLEVTAVNTFTGPTNLLDGVLDVSGSILTSSPIELFGGTLRGTGFIPAISTVSVDGSTIAPGPELGVGTLTVGSTTFESNATLEILWNGNGAVDVLAVQGSIVLGGTLALTLGFTPAVGESVVIINNDLFDAVTGTFSNLDSSGVLTVNGLDFQVSRIGGTGNDVSLTRILRGGTVSGIKYRDDNGNGTRDANEPGLSGWTIYYDQSNDSIFDPGEPFAITNADGFYEITVNQNFNYFLREVPQAGFSITEQPGAIALQDGVIVTDADFGNQPPPAPPIPPPPIPPPLPVRLLAVGAGAGGGPRVRVFDANGVVRFDFFAFDPSFTGGVHVATGDLNGDGTDDIITGAGFGGGPHVRAFDGVSGAMIVNFFAYEIDFRGGVYVTAGDVDGDGRAEVITGAGAGGSPLVRVFSAANSSLISSFFADDSSLRGGVQVAAGDLDSDVDADIVASIGGISRVRSFDGQSLTVLADFFPYSFEFLGDVNVATGDLNGQTGTQIITGPGPGGGPNVRVFTATGQPLSSFFADLPPVRGGTTVAEKNGQIATGAGIGEESFVRTFDSAGTQLDATLAFELDFRGGVFVG